MSIRATFHYFQGMECDMYSFYRIPKLLFTSEYFKNLSCEAKVLYGLMLDRMSLSIKNRWFDEEGRAYIFFSVEEIMEMLNCGRNKAVNCLKELDQEKGIGLIEKRRIGLGKTNVDINNRIVCFDIKELGKQLKKIGMLVIQDQVWNRVTMNRSAHKSTRYYVDEFHRTRRSAC